MKLYKSLLAALALVAASTTFTACDEDLAVPPLSIPHSDWKANTTIADFKTQYWSSEDNYYTEVGTTTEGEHVILGGRVVANDVSGNIYQNLVLQDETGAVTIAVSKKDLYKQYKVGEEMYIDVTGLYAGKYAGLFEIGKDDVYTSGSTSTPQIGKMEETTFDEHVQINGLPNPQLVNEIEMTIPELLAMASNTTDLIKYQSQLVRLKDVSFKGGGTETFAERGTSHNTRYLYDKDGQSIAVDNSGMSDFNDQVMPAGHGDVVAILSYYRTYWQLVLRSADDCIDFGGESYAPETPAATGDGSAESPYSVGAVIAGASGSEVWVTGYIVGWINGMSMSDGATFSVPASSNSNILLAQKADETNVGNCIPIALTNGSVTRTDLNLQSNPANLGRQVTIKGSLQTYFGSNGVKETTAYSWGDKGGDSTGTTPSTPSAGDGTQANPYTTADILAGASGTGVWFGGYIVGWVDGMSLSDGAQFNANATIKTNILVAASAGETNLANCVPVQLPNGSVRTALNLQDNPSNFGKYVKLQGDPATYFQVNGFKNTSAYELSGESTSPETPADGVEFRKATSVASGKEYLLVADGKMALLDSRSYGYLYVQDVTPDANGIITAPAENAFKFTAVSGGYNISMTNGMYLIQTGSFNSFNFVAAPTSEAVWTVVANSDGSFKITNTSVGKYIQYSSQYTSYGSYADATGTMPVLYEKVN